MKIIVTDQVHLSEIRPSDKPALLDHFKDREIYDRTLRIPYPYTEADADVWLAKVEQSAREQGRPVAWAVRDAGDYLIGGCGFTDFQPGQSHRADLGYWLAGPYRGRGIMTAVVARICDLAFAEYGLVKVGAYVFTDNAASARVLEKCGFEKEGTLRKHFLKDGRFLDAWLYGRVR